MRLRESQTTHRAEPPAQIGGATGIVTVRLSAGKDRTFKTVRPNQGTSCRNAAGQLGSPQTRVLQDPPGEASGEETSIGTGMIRLHRQRQRPPRSPLGPLQTVTVGPARVDILTPSADRSERPHRLSQPSLGYRLGYIQPSHTDGSRERARSDRCAIRDSNPEPAENRRGVAASSTPTAYWRHDLRKRVMETARSGGNLPRVCGDGRGVNRGLWFAKHDRDARLRKYSLIEVRGKHSYGEHQVPHDPGCGLRARCLENRFDQPFTKERLTLEPGCHHEFDAGHSAI